MDEELDVLVLKVRADTQGFAQDVEAMRGSLEGPLAAGVERAGRAMEQSLSRFIRTGKFGFEDLKRTALSVIDAIVQAQLQSAGAGGGFGGGSGGGGLASLLTNVALAFAGAPGRATGGPVAPGQAYLVGERGPELFVPTASGRVETGAMAGATAGRGAGRGAVTINVNVTGGAAQSPELMAKSGRQVARAVQRALARA